jgi:hypothetical protein
MIKLKSLLNEAEQRKSRNVSISPVKAKQLFPLFSDAIAAYKSKALFYRNVSTGFGNHIISNPQLVTRKSKDTFNLYYVLLDNLPSWKEYPSRSKSIIFTNSFGIAQEYTGETYNVFPKNGARIAKGQYKSDYLRFPYTASRIGSSDTAADVMDNFRRFIGVLSTISFDQTLLDLYHNSDTFSSKDYSRFISAMNEACEKAKDIIFNIDIKKIENVYGNVTLEMVKDIREHNKDNNWERYLNELFNPKDNYFELLSTADLKLEGNEDEKYEYWTDGVCYLSKLI